MTLVELSRVLGGTITGDSLHTQLAWLPIRIDRRRTSLTSELVFDLVVDQMVYTAPARATVDDIVATLHALVRMARHGWQPHIIATEIDDTIYEKRWRRWKRRARRIPFAVGTALIAFLLRNR